MLINNALWRVVADREGGGVAEPLRNVRFPPLGDSPFSAAFRRL